VALFLPLGGVAAASDHGLAESIDAEDKAMGWDRLERSGSVGGLAGSLGMGFAGPAGRTVLRVAHAAGWLWVGRSVQSSAPAITRWFYAGRCQLRCPRIKTSPADRPAEWP